MKVFFNHIAKTGGDSVHEALGNVLGEYYVDLNRIGLNQIRPNTRLEDLQAYTQSPNLFALGAHITTPNDDVCKELIRSCLGVAIVRNPLDRLESFYLYARRTPHVPIYDMAKSVGFDEFYDNLLKMAHHFVFPSQRAQLLYEHEVLLGGSRPDIESVDHVMAFLSRHYLLVGTTDNMATFYHQLEALLRRLLRQPELTLPVVQKNTRLSGEDAEMSPANIETMETYCAPDFRLHEHLKKSGGFFNEPLISLIEQQLR